MNIVKKVYLTVEGYDLVRKGETIVAGVSGGPDSVTMLHILRELNQSQAYDWRIIVAHLNHGIRGDQSNQDEEFVKSLAKELGLEFASRKVDVLEIKSRDKCTLEAAGRKARYDFLRDTAYHEGAQKIAVAHTMDDQAETVMHRIMRGTGLRGLKGMSPIRLVSRKPDLFIVRPLIEVERSEVEHYLSSQSLPFRTDETNKDIAITRNRIRHKLIPMIESDFNPRFRFALVRLAQTSAASYILLREIAKEVYENVKMLSGEGEVCLSVDEFIKTPPALQTLVIDRAVKMLHGKTLALAFEHYLEIFALCTDQGFAKAVTLPKGLEARRESYILKIAKTRQKPLKITFGHQKIKVPGTTVIKKLGIQVETEIKESSKIGLDEYVKAKDYSEEIIDLDKINMPLAVRLRKAGDSFIPLGLTGTCKLKKFFIDNKVPKDHRGQVPLLVDNNRIVWVVGYRISNDFRVTGDTRNVLMMRVKRISQSS